MTKLQIVFGIAILAIISQSCKNEVKLLAPYKDIPVVYCVLNQNDSIHYVRLEKSFAGEMNALSMAQEFDSLYYPEAEVMLEEYKERDLITSYAFEPVENIPRDSGIFAYNRNRVYRTSANLIGSREYKLIVSLPHLDTLITAQTHLVDGIRIVKPEYTRPTLALSSYNNYLEVEWFSTAYARVYFVQIRFKYLEVIGLDTTQREEIWDISHFISEHGQGGQKMETQILHENFYKWIKSRFDPPGKGIKRIATKKALDILFTVGGEELYTYMDVTDPNTSIVTQKPVYTNISNGIGLFSARYEQELKDKALTWASVDSLSYGQWTKGLGFVDSNDDYYIR